ncbi:MAG: hypothetical protein KGO02_24435 [Alphaproteobacteria bacterium]|nr:hypothetical protein [Alphaproteobacteria bacterium]
MKILQQSNECGGGFLVPLLLLTVLFALLPLVLAGAAYGTSLDGHSEQDVLRGPTPGPCYGLEGQAEYAGGTNAYGQQVTSAEGPYAPPPPQIPGQTLMARTGSAYVPVEVQGLNRALAASDACARLRAKERLRSARHWRTGKAAHAH